MEKVCEGEDLGVANGRKAVDVFDYGAADFLAGHLEDMKWGYINCCAFDGVLAQMFL